LVSENKKVSVGKKTETKKTARKEVNIRRANRKEKQLKLCHEKA